MKLLSHGLQKISLTNAAIIGNAAMPQWNRVVKGLVKFEVIPYNETST